MTKKYLFNKIFILINKKEGQTIL